MNIFKEKAEQYFEEIKRIRRLIHQYPETSHQEFKTSELIKTKLDEMNIPYYSIGDTGVVGLIEGSKPGKTIMIRGDMDALDIQEEVDVEYKSLIENKMHACGHDGHVASVLGAAMILNDMKDELNGNVKLMFQPSEEAAPSGAKMMIDNNILENPKVDAALGLHVDGELYEGEIGIKYGEMMASFTGFDIKIIGKGTHAAQPHFGIDPIMISAQVINNLQAIRSRLIDPIDTLVLSITEIKGGQSYNVIPEIVTMKGTIRTFSEEITDQVIQHMHDIINQTAKQYNGNYELIVDKDTPELINNDEMCDLVKEAANKIVEDKKVIILDRPSMGSEDFSFVANSVKSAFFYIGIKKDETPVIFHNPLFAWDEKVLINASAIFAQSAYTFLNNK